MLRLSVARLPSMQRVTLTSLCRFFNIKHLPGCLLRTSGMTCRYVHVMRRSKNCNKWWSWWYTTWFERAHNADMPFLICSPCAALESREEGHGRSYPFILCKQQAPNDKSFALRCTFQCLGFQRTDCLSNFSGLLKNKHSPGYSWWTSDMTCTKKLSLKRRSWWYTTQFGGAQNADMPLLTRFPSTALED